MRERKEKIKRKVFEKGRNGKEREMGLTGADPIANTRKPLGISGGFGIDEEAWLLASIAE